MIVRIACVVMMMIAPAVTATELTNSTVIPCDDISCALANHGIQYIGDSTSVVVVGSRARACDVTMLFDDSIIVNGRRC